MARLLKDAALLMEAQRNKSFSYHTTIFKSVYSVDDSRKSLGERSSDLIDVLVGESM